MIPLLCLHTPKPSLFLTRFPPPLSPSFPRFKSPPHRTHHFPILSNKNSSPIKTLQINNNHHHHHQEPFSLAVTNAPKLKSPTLSPSWTRRTSFVAVSKSVGIVVLNGSSDGGGGGSGKSLYEAAFLVKSVVRDRAYLLIGERVYIAAAVNARGVVLSDQGLPAFVVRNMLMGSKSESVVLPLVARIVQTPNAALNASNSEDKKSQDEFKSSSKLKSLDMENDIHEKTTVAGFVKWRIEKNSS